MTLGTMLFERNKVLLAPLVAVACGGVAVALAGHAWPRSSARASVRGPRGGKPGAPRPGGATAFALAVFFAACVAVTVWHATALALSRRSALRPALREALAFLRERTPADAIVVSPWEHGYEVQAYARRSTVMDGLIESPANQRRMIAFAEAAMMPAPDSLAAFCRRHRAGWLLVPPSTQLHAVAVAARAPIAARIRSGKSLTPTEADLVLVQMMVLGRSYPGFEKVFERDGYRVYQAEGARVP